MALTRVTLAGLIALTSSCGPKIVSFAVTPARKCAADTVSVTFAVRGTPTLRVAPPRAGANTDTTRYQLIVAKGGKKVQVAQDVLAYRGDDSDTLVLGPTRRLGTDSVQVQDSLRSDLWPDFVVIAQIASASGRPIAVSHNGRSATVGEQPAGTTLDGGPVLGNWDLRAALLPGERFATPGHSPPDRLRLQVVIRCLQPGVTP